MRIIIHSKNCPVVGSPQQVSGWGQHGHSLVVEGNIGEIELVMGRHRLSLRADKGKLDLTSHSIPFSLLLSNNVTLRTDRQTFGYGYEPG